MPKKFTDEELTAAQRKYARHKEYYRAHYQANKEKAKARYQAQKAELAAKHAARSPEERERICAKSRQVLRGFSEQDVAFFRREQGGKCAICPAIMRVDDKKHMHGEQADHCHVSKRARGLLCRACNQTLGVYEKWQRPAGLLIEPYESYLAVPSPFPMP